MKIFAREQEKHNEAFKDVNWFLSKGARVMAAIPTKRYNRVEVALLIADEDQDIAKNWYLQALDVVVEMCEYVLRHKNPSEFCLHWSA